MSVRRFFAIWLLLALVMTINGIARETILAPAIRRTPADMVSAALGITAILSVTGPFLRKARSFQLLAPPLLASFGLQ